MEEVSGVLKNCTFKTPTHKILSKWRNSLWHTDLWEITAKRRPLEHFSVCWKEQKSEVNLESMMTILLIFTLSLISGQLFIFINHIWSYLSWIVSVLARVISISKISFWLTGPVGCVDVIGYSGGSVIMVSKLSWSSENSNYICKMENRICTDILRSNTGESNVQVERFRLYRQKDGFLTMFIRRLKPQDAGRYSMRVATRSSTDVTLKVVNGHY